MHFTFSSLGSALVLSSLCGPTFAFPRLWGSRLESSAEKRNVCFFDDYLLSLNAFLPDTVPFCSSYLSIPLATATGVMTTDRTTTTTTSTSVITGVTVTTTDLVIETQITSISAIGYKKRAPAPSPAANIEATVWLSKVQRDAVADTSIAAALSSACSCLSVEQATTTIIPTASTTRTISAIDFEYATVALTATTTTIATVIVAATVTGYSSGGLPVPSTNVTLTLPPAPYPVNVTSISLPSEVPSSVIPTTPSETPTPFVPDGCPEINGTTITATDGRVFQVLCDVDFLGRDAIGLSEPDLQSCVEECSIANDGFSANPCLGVSYRPQLHKNCYLKTGVGNPTATNTSYEVVSAILITPLNFPVAPNITSTNSSSGIAVPAFNTTALPLGPTATLPINLTSLASITPSVSLNLTSLASITPSVSLNPTTTPAPLAIPTLSGNASRAELSSACLNCPNIYTSTIYSTTTVYVTVAAPSIF